LAKGVVNADKLKQSTHFALLVVRMMVMMVQVPCMEHTITCVLQRAGQRQTGSSTGKLHALLWTPPPMPALTT
jgi:hypothetical protein